MDRWEGKVAVVTGASSGIGAAIAEKLAEAGVRVVGLARRVERLEKLSESLKRAKGKFYPRKCDVSKEQDILDAFEWVNDELGGVDILINNAGIAITKNLIDDDIASFRNILNVNVLATSICIREAVASMKNRRVASGYIININSVAGHELPSRSTSLYAASKHAVTALTETVRRELAAEADNKIKITSISPGVVKTEIMHASNIPDSVFERLPHLDAKDIADAVAYVLGTRNKVHVTELTIRPVGESI